MPFVDAEAHNTHCRYPNWKLMGDEAAAESAQLSSRYTDSSLKGIISDIHLLSLCDYLVCTFSSQVRRITT